MGLRECIGSALDRGAISAEEAKYLLKSADKYATMNGAEAKAKFGEELRNSAAERSRVEILADNAQSKIYSDVRRFAMLHGKADIVKAAYALFENVGAGYQSFRWIRAGLLSQSLTEMNDFMHTFRRDAVGRRMNRPIVDDVVRALFGENVSDPAKALAASWSKVAEKLRGQFNAAGGHIGELKDWAVPQRHDAGAVLRAGFDKWRGYIEPRLDWDRIRSSITEAPVPQGLREKTLREVYKSIVTDGWDKRDPGMTAVGRGAMANQRDDARFLHFKDANSWLEYSRAFGGGEPYGALMDHVNGLTRDVALMRRFGPNPAAMVEYLKQLVASEGAKMKIGEPNMFPHARPALEWATTAKARYMLDGLYDAARGSAMPFSKTGEAIGMFRNLQYSAKLGSAVIVHAITNPPIQAMGRHLQGHSIIQMLPDLARSFTRNEADRAGLILEDAMAHMEQGAREQSAWLKAREVTRWLPAITTRFSGLDAVAAASRRSAFLGQMTSYASVAGKSFGELPARLRDGLRGFGIESDTWDKIRGSEIYDKESNAPLLRPQDVKDEDARLAYLGLLHGQNEAMVPTSNMHIQAATSFANRAPMAREVVKSMMMFKSGFMATFMLTQMQAMQRELTRNGAGALAGYVASSAIALTLAGMATLQLKNIAAGKDLRPMDASKDGAATWGHAMLTSGALGIYGDFIASDLSSYGHNIYETLAGPVVTGAVDAFQSAGAAARRLETAIFGGKGPPGSEEGDITKFLRNNTPVLSTHWALKSAFNRVLLDQAQYLADPRAHQKMRAFEKRVKQDTNQGMWWRPGELTPDRPPNFTMGR